MKIRIEADVLSGTAAEIMDQLRGRAFDPTEFPDTESYIWFLQNNVIRTTGLEFPLPEAMWSSRRASFLTGSPNRGPDHFGGLRWRKSCILHTAAIST